MVGHHTLVLTISTDREGYYTNAMVTFMVGLGKGDKYMNIQGAPLALFSVTCSANIVLMVGQTTTKLMHICSVRPERITDFAV